MINFDFENSKDPRKMAHTEPPNLDVHCLPSVLLNFQYEIPYFLGYKTEFFPYKTTTKI